VPCGGIGVWLVRKVLLVVVVAGGVLLGVSSSASATVTRSKVTTPADGALLLDNEVSSPHQAFTVAGTSDGTTGDFVYIDCVENPNGGGVILGQLGIRADGGFSGDVQMQGGHVCIRLLALPPSLQSGPSYSGPRLAISAFGVQKVSGGPNAGNTYDFELRVNTLTARSEVTALDDCGPSTWFGAASPVYVFDCGGNFYNSSADFGGPTDLTRAELQVDGQNAYGSTSANVLFSGSDALTGFPGATVTLNHFDTATGDAQVTDTEPLVRCSPGDVYNPTSADCTAFVSTGVSISRATAWTQAGRVATETDTYRSTDGKQHSLDLLYETDIGTPTSWKLPGQSSFTQHNTGDTAGPPASAPGTIYVGHNSAQPPSLTNPVGAMTFATPYDSIRFDNTLFSPTYDSVMIEYRRSVPAGGSIQITWSYASGQTLSEVQHDAAMAADAMQPPAISITSPASGSTIFKTPVTVTGTASAGSGVSAVTVNGMTAAVSGASWTAHVRLRPGKHTLMATVTSIGRATKTTSEALSLAVAKVNTSGRASDKKHGSTVLVTPGITVSCPPHGHACSAAETATTLASASAASAKKKKFVIGKTSFTVPAAQNKKLTFALNRTGRKLLHNLGHLKVTIAVVSRIDHGTPITTTKSITIKPPRKH
jgi:Glucodextranase, domain B